MVAELGGITLRRNVNVALDDQPKRVWNARTELEQRVRASQCELCGSQVGIAVHHIRAMKDLQKHGRPAQPAWVIAMATRQRKTLVVCRTCHDDIHFGRPKQQAVTA